MCNVAGRPEAGGLNPKPACDWPTVLRLRVADTLFMSVNAGVCITGVDEKIISVNPTLSDLTGYSKTELLGCTPRIFRSGLHTPDYYAEIWSSLQSTGQWSGEIWNRRRNTELYAARLNISAICNKRRQVTHYLGVLTDITQSKLLQLEYEKNATHDFLTGLPNRLLLADRLTQAMAQSLRTGIPLAICFFDLDGFKKINDIYGHAAGDRVLKEIAARLTASIREGDTVARLGGDEFVLLLWGWNQFDDCLHIIHRIIEEISIPILPAHQPTQLTVSVGVALYPQDGTDQQELLAQADIAMYQSKISGGNRVSLINEK